MVRQAFADPGSASPEQKWVHGAVGLRVGPSRAPDNNAGQLSGYEHSANDPFIEPALREKRESQVYERHRENSTRSGHASERSRLGIR